MKVYGESTETATLALSGSPSESSIENVSLKPGEWYTVSFTGGSSTGDYWLNYTVPQGYYLLVDHVPSSRSELDGVSSGYQRDYTIELRKGANAGGAPFAEFGGIKVGKSVTWEVGLGKKGSGDSANIITFKEEDLGLNTNPIDASMLMWAPPPNWGELYSKYDPNDPTFVRQISVPSGFVDITDGAIPNSYWLNFYRKDDIQGNPGGLNFPKPGRTPWKTIHVEQVGNNQLHVTVTEGDVSEVSFLTLTSGTLSSGNYTWQLQEGGLDQNQNAVYLRTTTMVSTTTSNGRELVTTIYGGANTSAPISSVTKQVFETFAWGESLVQTIKDPNGAALTTTLAYHEDANEPGNYRRVKSVTQPTGAWKAMWYFEDWDKRGQLEYEYAPFNSAPSTAPTLLSQSAANAAANSGKSVTYQYEEGWTTQHTRVTQRIEKTGGSTTGKSTWSYTDIHGNGHDWPRVESTQNIYRDATNYIVNKRQYYRGDAGPDSRGVVLYTQSGGITKTVHSRHPGYYSPGLADNFDTTSWSGYLRRVTMHGAASATGTSDPVSSWDGQSIETVHMEPNRSTMDIAISAAGYVLRTEKWVFTGGTNFELLSWTDHDYDDYWRVEKTEDHLGSVTDYIYSGGRLVTKFAPDDSETDFTYDYLGRLFKTTLNGVASRASYVLAGGLGEDWPGQADVVTTFIRNGGNQVTSTVITSGSLSKTTTAVYDLAGRVTSQSEPAPHGGVMTTGYAYANGGRTVTVTAPGNATKITEAYLDGSAKSISGTSVIRQDFEYAIFSGGNRVVATTLNNDFSTETQTEYDWHGNRIEERRPGWNGVGTRTSTWAFNNKGQLTVSTSTGAPDTLFFYDALGYQFRTVVDIDGDGTVDFSGPDRITETSAVFDNSAMPTSGWALVNTTEAYLDDSSSTKTTMSESTTRVSGFTGNRISWAQVSDIFGNETTVYSDRDPASHSIMTTTDTPQSNYTAREVVYFGRKVETVDDTYFRTNYDYDDFGRLTRQTHPRLGDAANDYYGSNLTTYYGSTSYVATATDHSGKNTTTFTYDAAGRIATRTNDEGGVTRYAYNDRGQTTHTWGDATYPVENVYENTFGKRTIMKTFRGNDASAIDWNTTTWPGGGLTADYTRWDYDPSTGLLDHKYDSANLNASGVPKSGAKSVDYTYTVAGQIATRTWARGVSTTYTYDPITAELTGVDYSDSTPEITNIYNRQGLLDTVIRGTDTITYEYCECGKTTAEHLGASQGSYHLIHHLDTTGTGTKGRTTGYTLTDNATTPNTLHAVDYAYDTKGRFDTLTTSGNLGAHVVDYSYHAESNLMTGWTVDATNTNHFSFTRDWDATRNLVSGTSMAWGSTPTVIADYDYTYDDMHRRMTAVQSGTAFADYGIDTHRRYAYNPRSELTGDYGYANGNNTTINPTDPMGDRAFEFAYDDIGNRITSNRTGNPALAETYTRNELNQYVSRTNDTLTTSGTVANTSTLVAARIKNDSLGSGGPWVPTDRVANYWSTSLAPRNDSQATRDTIDVVAVDPGAGSGGNHRVDDDDERSAILPPSAVTRTYDDDGNILTDGLYSYEWDAENRLVAMETDASPIWSGVNRRRYEHTYDHLHRRIGTTTSADAGAWIQIANKMFIYDGWNLIHEKVSDQDLGLNYTRSYGWGLDIKGSLSASAGVQGLAVMRDSHTSKTYLPGYDANGNVTVLVDAADGSIEAAYEYSPFGLLLRKEGDYAVTNPIRFSTKYYDEETQLSYYGRRYYDAKDGRFVGRDPIGEAGGMNLYAFVSNGPVNRWDYAGMYTPWLFDSNEEEEEDWYDDDITMDPYYADNEFDDIFSDMLDDIRSWNDEIFENLPETGSNWDEGDFDDIRVFLHPTGIFEPKGKAEKLKKLKNDCLTLAGFISDAEFKIDAAKQDIATGEEMREHAQQIWEDQNDVFVNNLADSAMSEVSGVVSSISGVFSPLIDIPSAFDSASRGEYMDAAQSVLGIGASVGQAFGKGVVRNVSRSVPVAGNAYLAYKVFGPAVSENNRNRNHAISDSWWGPQNIKHGNSELRIRTELFERHSAEYNQKGCDTVLD